VQDLIATPDALGALVESIRRSPVAVIDTEFIPEDSYEPRLCLVQVGTAEGIGIVDPLALPDLGALWQALTDPDRELVALGARQEILFCMRGAGRPPAKFVELQIAAGLVGYGFPLSQTKLVQRVLGVQIKGGEAFTDWRRRPLSQHQLRYAAEDVKYLLAARDRLMADARKMGRTEWIDAECRRFVERIVTGDAEEGWRRVSGSSSLDRRESAVLRELWRWRDGLARSADRPARKVFPDHLVIGVARRCPSKIEDLHALRGMERFSVRKSGTEILAAVKRGVELPEADCPPVVHRSDPPQVALLAQLLSAAAQTLAAQADVDTQLLATSADLQDLVRWHLGHGNGKPALLEGWRGTIVKPLVEILEGKRTVRVANVKSKHPLAFDGDSH